MVVDTLSHNTWETEAGGWKSQGQTGLHSETLTYQSKTRVTAHLFSMHKARQQMSGFKGTPFSVLSRQKLLSQMHPGIAESPDDEGVGGHQSGRTEEFADRDISVLTHHSKHWRDSVPNEKPFVLVHDWNFSPLLIGPAAGACRGPSQQEGLVLAYSSRYKALMEGMRHSSPGCSGRSVWPLTTLTSQETGDCQCPLLLFIPPRTPSPRNVTIRAQGRFSLSEPSPSQTCPEFDILGDSESYQG